MSTSTLTEREGYLRSFEREYQCTLRVLEHYPANQAQLRWKERSNTALQTAWVLVMSQGVVAPILSELALTPPPREAFQPPADWATLVQAFKAAHAQAMTQLAKLTDAQYDSTISMPVGPGGATAPVRRADALWMMLYDTIHHRGQLSVYLRASGAKVPSIYGPSGDEPWF